MNDELRCDLCGEISPDAEVESEDGTSLTVVCTSCADDDQDSE